VPRLSFRDRFLTPPVARAITSPLGILLAGAGAAAGIVAGLPIAGAAVVAVLAWAGRVAVAVPRAPRAERIDPFTLNDPWRRFVQDALQSQNRFREAARSARPGPLRDRLEEIGERVSTGVDECWGIAQRGQMLVDARRHIDYGEAERELAELRSRRDLPTPMVDSTRKALEAQVLAAQRIDRVILDARDRLRLLNARLDEAVARVAELSVRAGSVDDLTGLGDDVEGLVTEMEALRQGLDAVSGGSAGSLPAPG
jgi:hypothetical protein